MKSVKRCVKLFAAAAIFSKSKIALLMSLSTVIVALKAQRLRHL